MVPAVPCERGDRAHLGPRLHRRDRPAPTWYLAEGCTAPGFETWVLVQNPGDTKATIDMRLQ